MADKDFKFCMNSRVAEVLAPDEPQIQDFNGWDYTPEPVLPYRRRFLITLDGLRWYFTSHGTIDYERDPERNAGLLEKFYTTHRMHKPWNFHHEYLGIIEMRFNSPLNVPKALPDSGGLLDSLEVKAIHHNPSYE